MTKDKTLYILKKLIPGQELNPMFTGFYGAVPDKGYKHHPFVLKYVYETKGEGNEIKYHVIEKRIEDWLKAEMFRRFPDIYGKGVYTLGYFKLCESLNA
jgi:hypothetical protein